MVTPKRFAFKIGIKRIIFLLIGLHFFQFSTAQRLPSYIPTNDLCAYYPLNGNAIDASANANHGFVNGAALTEDRYGATNSAYFFNGSSSITIPSSPSLSSDITNQFSFTVWVKLTSYFNGVNTSFSPIFQKWNGLRPVSHNYKSFLKRDFVGFWGGNIPDFQYGYARKPIALNTWYFVAVTFNNGVVKFYLDGVLFFTQTFPVTTLQPSTNDSLELGMDSPGDVEYLNGMLDEFGLWKRALSATEIFEIYYSCINNSDTIFTQDTIRACGKFVDLDAGIGYPNYNWSNGATTQVNRIDSSGLYKCTINRGACSSVDSVYISIVNSDIESSSNSICYGDTQLLYIDSNLIKGNAFTNYSWSNGSVIPSTTVSPSYNTTYYSFADNGLTYCTDTFDINVKYPTHNTFGLVACDTFTWNGTVYASGGIYTYDYINASGCASTDTLYLTINNSTHNTETQVSCDTLTWNGTTYSISGVYTYDYFNTSGCASTDTLYLTINNSTHNTETQVSCDTLTWNGTTYSISGVYTYDYFNTSGCASTDTLYLTINNSIRNSETQVACDSYSWNGADYTSSGVYVYNYLDPNGCAGADTLNLTINNAVSVTEVIQAYNSYTWNGVLYTSSNYTDTWTGSTINGCDSVVTLNLTILPNDFPTAIDDEYIITQDSVLSANVSDNDIPSTDGGNTWSLVDGTLNGSLIFNNDGSFTYTPDPLYFGEDSFYYRICDNFPDCDTSKALIYVTELVPANLISFDVAKCGKNTALVNWKIQNESNVLKYVIESSEDGLVFNEKSVLFPSLTGGGNFVQQYDKEEQIDASSANVYFRLHIIGKNGKSTFSKIVMFKNDQWGEQELLVSPNPFADHLNLTFYADNEHKKNSFIKLYSADGNCIYSLPIAVQKGKNNMQVNGLNKVAKGMYVIEVSINGQPARKAVLIRQ